MIHSEENRILYIVVTKDCMLSCPFCFNKFVENFKKFKPSSTIDLYKALDAIDEVNPQYINFIGGEPLIYPTIISDIINHTEARHMDSKRMWCISTNLFYPNLSKMQIECLRTIQDNSTDYVSIGTSYSTDRFKGLPNYLETFRKNMDILDKENIRVGLTVTLTDDLVSTSTPEEMLEFAYSVKAKSINIERVVHGYNDFKDLELLRDQYDRSDEWMKHCFEIIPRELNYQYQRYYDSAKLTIPIFKTKCSREVFSLYDHGLYKGCPLNGCNDDNLVESRLDIKKLEYDCYSCSYYPYCLGDCECTRQVCAFPKKTLDYMKDVVKDEYLK